MSIQINFDSNVPDWEKVDAEKSIGALSDAIVNPIDGYVTVKYAPLGDANDTASNNPTTVHVTYARYLQAIQDYGSAAAKFALAGMPATDPFPQGPNGDTIVLTTAQAEALHVIDPAGPVNFGTITLNSDNRYAQDPATGGDGIDATASLIHEGTEEILGRFGRTGAVNAQGQATYGALDFTRFDLNGDHSYVRQPGDYFSLRGTANLKNFNNQPGDQDAGDWSFTQPYAVQGDAFGATSKAIYQAVTPADLTAMRATGVTIRGAFIPAYDALPHGALSAADLADAANGQTLSASALPDDPAGAVGTDRNYQMAEIGHDAADPFVFVAGHDRHDGTATHHHDAYLPAAHAEAAHFLAPAAIASLADAIHPHHLGAAFTSAALATPADTAIAPAVKSHDAATPAWLHWGMGG